MKLFAVLAALAVAAPLPAVAADDALDLLAAPSDTYTVLDFAASWCTPCYRALPRLQALARELPDLRVVVVSVDETERGRDRLVRELDLELEVVWDGDHALISKLAPEAFPATYVLDPSGEVVYSHLGYDPLVFDEFAEVVRGLQREVAAGRAANGG